MTEKFSEGTVDTGKQAGTPQVDNFSKELSDFLSDEKLTNKEQLSNFLISNSDLKNGFEDYLKTANLRQKIKCKKELQNCSTEEEIKSIILENIPEGYTVGGDELGDNMDKIENIEDKDFINTKEQADQKIEQADQKTEQADQKTEQADQKTEQADQKTEQDLKRGENLDEHEVLRKAVEERDKLVAKYQGLEARTNQTSENYKTVKTQLENNGILNQLRQSHDEQFINDYILVQTTLQELKSNPTSYEQSDISFFDKLVKNLDNSCNIPDTNLNSFSSENISQTRKELFNEDIGNDDLIEVKKSNLESRKYPEGLFDMENDEIIAKYGKFLEGGLKDFWLQYQTNPDMRNKINNIQNDPNPTDEDKQILNNYNQMHSAIENVKENLDTRTKDLMEELCIISQIKGMYMCMGEGDNFDLNKSRGIRYDKEGAMILDGHVDGVAFSIRQDINNPEARLQTSQKIAKLNNGDVFSVGGKDNFVDSNFILPSQNEIFQVIAEAVQSDESLADFDNQSDYIINLQTNIMGKMEKKYENTKYVHHYMEGQVKGEKIADKTLGLIGKINPSIINDTTLMKNITQESNKDLYDFMKILKFNIDNSTDLEKDHFSRCISQIGEIIRNYITNKKSSGLYSDEISKYLENDTWTDGTQEDRLKLIFNLFNHFNENSIDKNRVGYEGSDGLQTNMFINDLYIQLHDKPKQKQEQQQEQEDKEKETNIAFINLMAAYDQTESMA